MPASRSRPCPCYLCEPSENPLAPHRQRVADDVREHGWHVITVAAGEQLPGWAYSIGIWHTLDQVEVSVFGLPPAKSLPMINAAGAFLRDGGRLLTEENCDEIVTGYPVAVRWVDPSWHEELLGQAIAYYRGRMPTYVQLVWPDSTGLFPWQAGVEASCRDGQPMLWLPQEEQQPGPWSAVVDDPDPPTYVG